MKRYAPPGLAVAGIVSFAMGVWWLLTQATEEAFGASFFFSAGVSLLVHAGINPRWMHETVAALLGAAALWLANYVGDTFYASLHIIGVEGSMVLVSWLNCRRCPNHQRIAPAQGTGRW